jgi:putative transcriptional regulator
MKTVEIPDAPTFNAKAVHTLRDRLGLSQALFAKLLGVSRKLVEAWEAGTRTPSPMACRLLDAIEHITLDIDVGEWRNTSHASQRRKTFPAPRICSHRYDGFHDRAT